MLNERVIPSVDVVECGDCVLRFGRLIKDYFDGIEPDLDATAFIQSVGVALESVGYRLCDTANRVSENEEELKRLRKTSETVKQATAPRAK